MFHMTNPAVEIRNWVANERSEKESNNIETVSLAFNYYCISRNAVM